MFKKVRLAKITIAYNIKCYGPTLVHILTQIKTKNLDDILKQSIVLYQ